MIRRAMELAAERGMRFQPVHSRAGIADIFCATCGWPDSYRETKIAQYADEPYGCARCARKAEDEHPRPGLPQGQDRTQ